MLNVAAMKEPIQVWEFYDAPEYLRTLSINGGDEDWIVRVPSCYSQEWLSWLEEGKIGNIVDEFKIGNGDRIFIVSHA